MAVTGVLKACHQTMYQQDRLPLNLENPIHLKASRKKIGSKTRLFSKFEIKSKNTGLYI